VSAESPGLNQGATFTVRLPAREAEARQQAAAGSRGVTH
jgi:hypothetical protein